MNHVIIFKMAARERGRILNEQEIVDFFEK